MIDIIFLCAVLVSGQSTTADLVRDAERIVVGTVRTSAAAWETVNGDQLIVTTSTIEVEEILKGAAERNRILTMKSDGGKINGVTLTVSDIDPVEPGQRAVFFERGGRAVGVYRLNSLGVDLAEIVKLVKGKP